MRGFEIQNNFDTKQELWADTVKQSFRPSLPYWHTGQSPDGHRWNRKCLFWKLQQLMHHQWIHLKYLIWYSIARKSELQAHKMVWISAGLLNNRMHVWSTISKCFLRNLNFLIAWGSWSGMRKICVKYQLKLRNKVHGENSGNDARTTDVWSLNVTIRTAWTF